MPTSRALPGRHSPPTPAPAQATKTWVYYFFFFLGLLLKGCLGVSHTISSSAGHEGKGKCWPALYWVISGHDGGGDRYPDNKQM